jgi:hypothetical protein
VQSLFRGFGDRTSSGDLTVKLSRVAHKSTDDAADKHWWKDVDITAYGALWGGEIAADRYTNDLRPATVTIYVAPAARTKNLARLIAERRLRPDPKGEIEVLERFWDFDTPAGEKQVFPDVVPPLLV